MEGRVPAGIPVHHNVSCNTKFILASIDDIEGNICQAYHFVDKKYLIYLVLNNVGSHMALL